MSQRVKAGGIATFVCIATGDPTPHITWRKDKKPIPQRYDEIPVLIDRPLTNLLLVSDTKSSIFPEDRC